MAGVAGKSGKPPLQRAGLPLENAVLVEHWPWMYGDIPWTHEEILKHLAETMRNLGITRSEADIDFVVQMADNHYQKQYALQMIDEGARVGDVKLFKDASAILRTCNEKISSARIALGVGRNSKVEPRPTAENVINISDFE